MIDGAEIPVLGMEEIEALAENPAFVVVLDAEPLPRVQPPEPPLPIFRARLVDERPRACRGFSAS